MVTLDIARTEEDFRQCAELLKKTHPGEELPNFGDPMTTTFIVRDTVEPGVQGVIHADFVPEIHSMAVNPEYRFQDASYTLLHQMMEGHFRIAGHRAVFHTVPDDKTKVQKLLTKTGAEPIHKNHARFRKEL